MKKLLFLFLAFVFAGLASPVFALDTSPNVVYNGYHSEKLNFSDSLKISSATDKQIGIVHHGTTSPSFETDGYKIGKISKSGASCQALVKNEKGIGHRIALGA